jgi:hypothetical protein
LEDLDGLDMWWGWKKVVLPSKSFVPNQEEMEDGRRGRPKLRWCNKLEELLNI